MTNNKSREKLEKLHDACKDGNHKWEVEKQIVCTVCGIYQDEYNQRNKK